MSSISVDTYKVLNFQHERIVKGLFKSFLMVVEDLEREHNVALGKLHDSLPPEYQPFVNLADYLDEDKVRMIRKRILDNGNNACRELTAIVEQFNITLK